MGATRAHNRDRPFREIIQLHRDEQFAVESKDAVFIRVPGSEYSPDHPEDN